MTPSTAPIAGGEPGAAPPAVAPPPAGAATVAGPAQGGEIATLVGALAPVLSDLEAEHRVLRARALRVAAGLGSFVAAVGVVSLTGLFGSFWPLAFGIGLAVAGVGWHLAMNERVTAYRNGFKQGVVGHLVAHRYPGATFEPYQGIDIDAFRASRLFRQGIDRYRTEDLIAGRSGATDLRIAEVHAEYKTTTTDSRGRTRTTWHTIFRGVLCIADFHKHFHGVTLVVPDGAEGFLGDFGRRLQSLGRAFSDAKLVELEDPEFERAFAVYGTDQVEARYILSTSLMRRLLDFRARQDAPVRLAFVDEQVYVAVSSGANHFEPPSIWAASAAIDEAGLAEYLAQVELARDIVESLNLNTRIWSKA